jgi:hypothetical protein
LRRWLLDYSRFSLGGRVQCLVAQGCFPGGLQGGMADGCCQMLVRVPDLEKDLTTESMLEESPDPHWGTGSPVAYRQVLYKVHSRHSRHSACNCWHVPTKYLFSSSVSWGSKVFFEDSHSNQKKRIAFFLLALGLVALFLAGLVLQVLVGGDLQSYSVLSSIAACTGCHGQIYQFLKYRSVVKQVSMKSQSPLYSPKVFAVPGRAWDTRMKHSSALS